MKHIWFKRKLYGWGWTPITWQGWTTIFAYIAVLAVIALSVDESTPPQDVLCKFALPLVIITAALITICYKKGEKPRWQWGKDLGDKK